MKYKKIVFSRRLKLATVSNLVLFKHFM